MLSKAKHNIKKLIFFLIAVSSALSFFITVKLFVFTNEIKGFVPSPIVKSSNVEILKTQLSAYQDFYEIYSNLIFNFLGFLTPLLALITIIINILLVLKVVMKFKSKQ